MLRRIHANANQSNAICRISILLYIGSNECNELNSTKINGRIHQTFRHVLYVAFQTRRMQMKKIDKKMTKTSLR